ncbi:hypothetical protein AGMMS50225_08140 [Betaproteobacteria bacterium]|nr:hypothetical protein AGMMS50225_08140 [Betaproteobacteria bacterium]
MTGFFIGEIAISPNAPLPQHDDFSITCFPCGHIGVRGAVDVYADGGFDAQQITFLSLIENAIAREAGRPAGPQMK